MLVSTLFPSQYPSLFLVQKYEQAVIQLLWFFLLLDAERLRRRAQFSGVKANFALAEVVGEQLKAKGIEVRLVV